MNRFRYFAMCRSILCASICLASVSAIASEHKPMTVAAMLRLESELIAKQLATKRNTPARAKAKPILVSIYGVATELQAVVRINGVDVVFEQGRRQPLTPHSSSVRLRHIKPPCVSFVLNAQHQTLCLSVKGS